ncbi:MAG: hypothetical protein MJE66_17050 [Proteobacteria bacterium]|nr:hypothetical protein [Pseudomonadota bacterium]
MSLAEALERAAHALPAEADVIRPANGDPMQLLDGLDADARPRVLAWLLVHESQEGEELAAAWAEAEEGIEAVAAVDEASLPKAGRKGLRRIRHRLRSSGAAAIESAAPTPVVSRLRDVEEEFARATVSALDPTGARMVALVESHPGGGARVFEAIIDDERGILRCDVYTAGRSKVRQFLRRLLSSSGLRTVEVERDEARALLARAETFHPKSRSLPRGFSEWRTVLVGDVDAAAVPGVRVREALGEEEDAAAARERVAARVRESELGPWLPNRERLQELGARLEAELGDASGDPEAVLEPLVVELFAGEFGQRTAFRLREAAFVEWQGDRPDAARDLLAAARGFEADPVDPVVGRALLDPLVAPILSRRADEGAAGGAEASPAEPA